MMRFRAIYAAPFTVLLFLGSPLFSPPAEAQIRLMPQGGLYTSISDLGTVDTGDEALRVGEKETSFAYGLTVEIASEAPVRLRLTGLYGSNSEVPVGGIGCTPTDCDLESTLLALSAGVVLSPVPTDFPFRPFLLAGGGMKRYDFEFQSDSQLKEAFGDESVAALLLGLGFDWNLGILSGTVELADYISGSAVEGGDRQHDFFLTVGLILG